MSNPQYQNNEGYDDQRPRVHKGFDKYSSPQLNATQVAAAVRAENEKYPGFLHGLDNKPFKMKIDQDPLVEYLRRKISDDARRRADWEGDALTQARRKLALEAALIEMPKYVLNSDGTMEIYSPDVHGALRKCHFVRPQRNAVLLTDTPAGRIHDATLSGNKDRILVAWEKYGTVVGNSRLSRGKSSLWQRFCYWLGWQCVYICNWFRNLFGL